MCLVIWIAIIIMKESNIKYNNRNKILKTDIEQCTLSVYIYIDRNLGR